MATAESQKLTRTKDYLNSAKKRNCGTIVGRFLEDEQYQMRMHEEGHNSK